MDELSHLPVDKQKDILEIVEIIKEIALPEKVILFGSFARGDWVDDEYVEDGATYTYRSDFDFLIVVREGLDQKDFEITSKIENRTLSYKNDVSPIVHSIDYINKGLSSGQYFFRDIVKEGKVLFNNGKTKFADLATISIETQQFLYKQYYDNWILSGINFFQGTKVLLENALINNIPLNQVMFNLNQSVERFLGGILLVYTGYKPKTHNIKVLSKYAKHISGDLNLVFISSNRTSEELRLFDLLNKSYIDSRYQNGYTVELSDVLILIDKVNKLEELVISLVKLKMPD